MKIELGATGLDPFKIFDDDGREIQEGLAIKSMHIDLGGVDSQTMVNLEVYANETTAHFIKKNLGVEVVQCSRCREVFEADKDPYECPQP